VAPCAVLLVQENTSRQGLVHFPDFMNKECIFRENNQFCGEE